MTIQNNNKKWKEHEKAVIARFHNNHMPNTITHIANILGRTSDGVSRKITRLKKTGEYEKLKQKYSISGFDNDICSGNFIIENMSIEEIESECINSFKERMQEINNFVELYDDNIELYILDNVLKARIVKYEEI